MTEKKNPAKPATNAEKFKPQNVAGESAGNVTSAGRKDRNMEKDMSRGSGQDIRNGQR